MSWDEIVEKALEYFENNEDEFNLTIEELDSWCGYLDGQRYEYMDYIGEFFYDSSVKDIIEAALNGTDVSGGSFDTDRQYFYWDWNQLVSTDNNSYSDWLDKYFIDKLYEEYYRNRKRNWFNMELPKEIEAMFSEYYENEVEDTES